LSPLNPATFNIEQELFALKRRYLCGIDEVGRGAWAGPLTVGAVLIDSRCVLEVPELISTEVKDSKLLSPKKREMLSPMIKQWALDVFIEHIDPAEIDLIGLSASLKLASRRILQNLPIDCDHVLLDGRDNYVGLSNVQCVVKGDQKSILIAAASIVAKVARDNLMREAAANFEPFEFERNKGYGSKNHLIALQGWGLTVFHRRSWSYLNKLCWYQRALNIG